MSFPGGWQLEAVLGVAVQCHSPCHGLTHAGGIKAVSPLSFHLS